MGSQLWALNPAPPPPHLPPTAGPTFRVRVGGRGHNAGPGRGVSTLEPPASGSGHMPGVGTGKKEELLAWKRGGAGPLATAPSPVTNKVPKGSREIPVLDSGSPLRGHQRALGHHQTGPHPGSKCQVGQLKKADKGRTIPDLKNAWKYLPEGLALRGNAEELGLITPWAAFCCAEAPGGQSCQALGEGQGGWSLARTCGCTCLPDRLA